MFYYVPNPHDYFYMPYTYVPKYVQVYLLFLEYMGVFIFHSIYFCKEWNVGNPRNQLTVAE